MAAVEADIALPSWRGALSLSFATVRERTVVTRRRHEGPFCIQQPVYHGDGACHVYLLHPPGGLAGGDELALDVEVNAGGAALLTTPAATKFYRSETTASVQTQTLRVAAGASLEWLPLETILFGGSRAAITTDVHLDAESQFMGWEATTLGRPLSGDHYATGTLEQRTRIYVDDEPQLHDTLRWQAGDPLLSAQWGLAGFGVCGALYAHPADAGILALVRGGLSSAEPPFHDLDTPPNPVDHLALRCGATLLGRVLVIRCLAREPETLRNAFERLWSTLRPAVVGRAPSAPRIWKT
jgi:urease accessory protein